MLHEKGKSLVAMGRWMLLFTLAVLPAVASPKEEPKQEENEKSFEAEFVASDIFRSGSLILPLVRRLGFEGHYFGGEETDTGFTGVSWTFAWKELKLIPGFGVVFGSNEFTTSPAFSFRWEYERKWFITQGLVIQSFRDTPIFEEEGEGAEHNEHEDVPSSHEPVGFVRPTISDGNHVSARWRRLTIGGTWEHIAFREGSEWKGGGRLAIRILPRVSGILYVLAPGRTEWRGGILIHSAEK
jgi:hypothetical protein